MCDMAMFNFKGWKKEIPIDENTFRSGFARVAVPPPLDYSAYSDEVVSQEASYKTIEFRWNPLMNWFEVK